MALKEVKVFATSGKKKTVKGQCSKGDECGFWHESNDRAKPTPKAAPPSGPPTSKHKCVEERERQRQKSVWEVRSTAV